MSNILIGIVFAMALGADGFDSHASTKGIASVTYGPDIAILPFVVETDPGPPIVFQRESRSCAYEWISWRWFEDVVFAQCVNEDWIECDVEPDIPHDPDLAPFTQAPVWDDHGSMLLSIVQCIGAPRIRPVFSEGFE